MKLIKETTSIDRNGLLRRLRTTVDRRSWNLPGDSLGLLISAWVVAGALLAPANRIIGEPPKDLPVVSVTIDSESSSRIATWCIPAEDSKATVILLHGIRGDRRSMLGRAKLLHQAGYSVVMIDLQAHGESPGAQITIGHLEQHDVRAAVSYVRMMQPNHRIGVIGVSLGGAAALLGSPLDVDVLVLESVFPTIADAVHNRVAVQVGAAQLRIVSAFALPVTTSIGNLDEGSSPDRQDGRCGMSRSCRQRRSGPAHDTFRDNADV